MEIRLTLRELEIFQAIMISGSVSGAAKLLNISQPAVSRMLGHMESRLRLTLFKRIRGRVYPTPEAHLLFTEVKPIFASLHRVDEIVEDLIKNRVGRLRIGCSPSLGQSLIPRAIARFHERFPETEVVLHTMIPDVLLRAILSKQVELGIAVLQETHPNLNSRPLYENRLLAAIPIGHPLVAKNAIHIHDLVDQSLIGYGSDHPLGSLMARLFHNQDRPPHIKTEVQQAHVACALVEAGAGIALIDELTASGPVWSNVALRPIEPKMTAPVSVINAELEPLSRLAEEFVSTLESLR